MFAAVLAALGASVHGVPIRSVVRGEGPATVLAVGDIHGNERAGRAVIRRLRRMDPPRGVRVVTVKSANPDGAAANTRQNAHGVDLNRNFPYRWRGGGRPFDTYYPGAGAASEPETQALMQLIRRERPAVTLWYHQHLALVNLVPRADRRIIRRYGRAVGLPARWLPRYHGTATSWQNKRFVRSTAFVVELPAGSLSRADARRHARAAIATVAPRGAAAARKPRIESDPIPFPMKRKREMRRYSRRHYGELAYKLREVKTIVEHYTANDSYSATWNTFARDAPDPELHELPGTCTHFVIDTDGTIHQLVSLRIRCRHTVGLNDRSIGIEHVGTSDAAVMGNRRMLRASLRLTRWLQDRYDVPTRHVIGHAESLSSPFHHERVARLRTQTHGDMQPATMKRYRRKL
jgi:beta-N-acetylhexosaminidase